MTWRVYVAVVVLCAGFAVGWSVNDWRRDAEVLDLMKARDALRVQISEVERARLVAQNDAAQARRELEDAAHADQDATGGLPVGRVRRLLIE